MRFDDLVTLLVEKACRQAKDEGERACSSKRPSSKITVDTPTGHTITVDLGVAVSGYALLGLVIVVLIVLKLLGRVHFDFGRAGHRLGRGQRRRDDVDGDKTVPAQLPLTASAPPAALALAPPAALALARPALARPASLPLPQGPSWPVAAPRDLQVGAVSGRTRLDEIETSSMKSVASALESTC